MKRLINLYFIVLLGMSLTAFSHTPIIYHSTIPSIESDAQHFRNEVLHFVRQLTTQSLAHQPLNVPNQLEQHWDLSNQNTHWNVKIALFNHGVVIANGNAHEKTLVATLTKATLSALAQLPHPIPDVKGSRFKISFAYYPNQLFSFVEWHNQGLEMVGNRITERRLTSQDIKKQITNSAQYLLKVMHPKWHGFYKFYNAKTDVSENKLRTIYTASSLLTLIKLNQLYPTLQLEQFFRPIAKFLLSMQIKGGQNQGGFYYSFSLATATHSNTAMVGTTSKTIFTLLALYRFYHDQVYLNAAKHAGDWILTKIQPDGRIVSKSVYKKGQWITSLKQSHLYSGQALSALSRLYLITNDKRYLKGAGIIASHFLTEVSTKGLPVSDDYRKNTIIGTSWVLMSLLDYSYLSDNKTITHRINQIADYLISTQINNINDLYYTGRFSGTASTSGNGWINEVLGEYYSYCLNNKSNYCHHYLSSMISVSRWLVQNAYNERNDFDIKNPSRAIGGFIRIFSSQQVRTDAVCHGANSFIHLLTFIGLNDHLLLMIPERPFQEILPSLRAGWSVIKND